MHVLIVRRSLRSCYCFFALCSALESHCRKSKQSFTVVFAHTASHMSHQFHESSGSGTFELRASHLRCDRARKGLVSSFPQSFKITRSRELRHPIEPTLYARGIEKATAKTASPPVTASGPEMHLPHCRSTYLHTPRHTIFATHAPT